MTRLFHIKNIICNKKTKIFVAFLLFATTILEYADEIDSSRDHAKASHYSNDSYERTDVRLDSCVRIKPLGDPSVAELYKCIINNKTNILCVGKVFYDKKSLFCAREFDSYLDVIITIYKNEERSVYVFEDMIID